MTASMKPQATLGAPLVSPGAPLTPERLARFSRQLLMPGFGEIAQRRLANARVLVVGAGGLGSASIPYLAAAGVGTIGVIDSDVVEPSNLHRQVAHGMQDIGRSKVDSIADAVAAIDPEVQFHRHNLRMDSHNALDLLAGYDLVMDGSDNFPTRYLTNDAAALAGMPLVWGAILRYSGQASVSWAEHGSTYRDLFPSPPGPDEILNCADGGVLPTVCAVIGAIMCGETIKIITGIGDPLIGRVTTYDALTGRHRELEYASNPDAAPITELIDYELFCRGATSDAAESGQAGESTGATHDADTIDSQTLSQYLADRSPMQLVDVREPFEAKIVCLPDSDIIPLGALAGSLDRIRSDVPVVLYCHHGVRSRRALDLLQGHGFTNVQHLDGGVEAYATLIDPALARY